MTSGNAGHRGLLAFPVVHGCLWNSRGKLPGGAPGCPRGPRPPRAVHACPESPAPVPGPSRPPVLVAVPGADRGGPGSPCGGPGAPPLLRGCDAPQWGRRGSHPLAPPVGRRVFRTPRGAVFRIRPVAYSSRSGHGRITRMSALPSGASRAGHVPEWALTCGFSVVLGGLARRPRPCCADSGWCVRFAGPDPSWHGVGPLGGSSGKKANVAIRGQHEKNGRDNLDKMLREFRR